MKYLLFFSKIIVLLFLYSCADVSINNDLLITSSKEEVIVDIEENQKETKPDQENIKTEETIKEIDVEEKIYEDEHILDLSEEEINKKQEITDQIKETNLKYEEFDDIVKIGLLVPLSGKNSFLGNAIYRSAEMALFENNSSRLELLPIDSGNTIEQALTAAKKLEEENVSLIIGPVFSSQAKAVRSNITDNIPIMSFTNDESISRQGLWSFGFSPRQEISAIFNEMSNYNIKNLSVIIPNSAYGNIALDNIKKQSAILNLKIENVYKYKNNSNNFEGLGLEIKEKEDLEIDALLILAGGEKLREISSRAQYRGINPKETIYFGISSWNSTKILGEPSLLKGIFIAPEQSSYESFVSRYYKIYGSVPPEIGGLSYDMLSLCAIAINNSKNPDQFISFLIKPSGFNGVFGYFVLKNDGLLKRKFASYQVMKRSFVKKK